MKNIIQKIIARLQPIVSIVKPYRITIFIVCFLGVYTLLVVRINSLVNREPDPSALSAKLQTVKRLSIDQGSIDRILQLEEQNVDVRTLFE